MKGYFSQASNFPRLRWIWGLAGLGFALVMPAAKASPPDELAAYIPAQVVAVEHLDTRPANPSMATLLAHLTQDDKATKLSVKLGFSQLSQLFGASNAMLDTHWF